MLGPLGWVHLQRLEMVVQDNAVVAKYLVGRLAGNEFRINDEMLFRAKHRSSQHECEGIEIIWHRCEPSEEIN